MILDKLIEKKDLTTFLSLRIEHLKQEQKMVVRSCNPQKREKAFMKLSHRIEEAEYLRRLININFVKQKSKTYWRKLK